MSMAYEQRPNGRRRKANGGAPQQPPQPQQPYVINVPPQPQNFGAIVNLLNEAARPFIGERPTPYDPGKDHRELYRDPRERNDLPLHVDQDKEARHGINDVVYAIRVQLWEIHRTLFLTMALALFLAIKSGVSVSDLLAFLGP